MPTVTPLVDDAPTPRATITFSAAELAPTVSTLSVVEISEAGEIPVRNGSLINGVGGAVLTDYEVPLGVPVTYQAEQFDAAGVSLGLTSSATTTVSIPAGWVVISDPFAPRQAIRARAEVMFAESLSYSRDVKLYRRGTETVALMGQLGLLEDVNLRVLTESDADVAMMMSVLSGGNVLIRSMPPVPLPRVLHAVVGKPRRVPLDARLGGAYSVWDISGVEVSRPSMSVVEAVSSWGLYKSAYPTWADAKAAYTTWLDAKSNPPAEA